MAVNPLALPTYIKNNDQENYNQDLNQTLQYFLNPDGWQPPNLTTAQSLLAAPFLAVGAFWFNITLGKMQLKVAQPAVIETFTSV